MNLLLELLSIQFDERVKCEGLIVNVKVLANEVLDLFPVLKFEVFISETCDYRHC